MVKGINWLRMTAAAVLTLSVLATGCSTDEGSDEDSSDIVDAGSSGDGSDGKRDDGAGSSPSSEPSGVEVPDCAADLEAEACGVFQLVNQYRVEADLQPYAWDSALAMAATLHAQDMIEQDYFSHTGEDGSSFSDRALDAGYTGFPTGENIAQGQRSPDAVMTSWMNSAGHRQNIMSGGSNEIGVGFANNTWVQVFGSE